MMHSNTSTTTHRSSGGDAEDGLVLLLQSAARGRLFIHRYILQPEWFGKVLLPLGASSQPSFEAASRDSQR